MGGGLTKNCSEGRLMFAKFMDILLLRRSLMLYRSMLILGRTMSSKDFVDFDYFLGSWALGMVLNSVLSLEVYKRLFPLTFTPVSLTLCSFFSAY
jgi:hypothetical protein